MREIEVMVATKNILDTSIFIARGAPPTPNNLAEMAFDHSEFLTDTIMQLATLIWIK